MCFGVVVMLKVVTCFLGGDVVGQCVSWWYE